MEVGVSLGYIMRPQTDQSCIHRWWLAGVGVGDGLSAEACWLAHFLILALWPSLTIVIYFPTPSPPMALPLCPFLHNLTPLHTPPLPQRLFQAGAPQGTMRR